MKGVEIKEQMKSHLHLWIRNLGRRCSDSFVVLHDDGLRQIKIAQGQKRGLWASRTSLESLPTGATVDNRKKSELFNGKSLPIGVKSTQREIHMCIGLIQRPYFVKESQT